MRRTAMQVFAWVGACHIAHFEANKVLSARISAFFMRLVNREEFDYWAAVSEQGQSLNELRALDAALEIKKLADLQGGWEMHHGILRLVRRPSIHHARILGFSVGPRMRIILAGTPRHT